MNYYVDVDYTLFEKNIRYVSSSDKWGQRGHGLELGLAMGALPAPLPHFNLNVGRNFYIILHGSMQYAAAQFICMAPPPPLIQPTLRILVPSLFGVRQRYPDGRSWS